ncbi:DUF485 domain-containing protein [bacterium]|nr:DUF485 domain-containing protein [candidate division CSSED10-310 bacterium]
MLHGPAVELKEDHATPHKQKLGVIMFLIYAAIYAGFVGINLINPVLMETTVLLGMNLACVYGFGLIVFALALALIYNTMCQGYEKKFATPSIVKGDVNR